MKRAFLILLVFFTLLCATAIQHTLASTPVSSEQLLGLININSMIHALPTGIFTAAALIAALGIGAEFWRALLPVCGADWAPTRQFTLMADAALWCSWLVLASCLNAQFCIFPATFTENADSLYSVENYRMLLLIAGGIMICMRLFNTYIPRRQGIFIVLASAAVAIALGQFWWNGLPIDFLSIALLLPVSAGLLIPTRKENAYLPFVWLTITASALALYATGFSQLIINYPTGPIELSYGWLCLKFTANTLMLLSLILLLIPQLKHMSLVRQSAGGACIISCLLYNWAAIAAPLDAALPQPLPLTAAGITYSTTLICLTALFLLRINCHRKLKETR